VEPTKLMEPKKLMEEIDEGDTNSFAMDKLNAEVNSLKKINKNLMNTNNNLKKENIILL